MHSQRRVKKSFEHKSTGNAEGENQTNCHEWQMWAPTGI